MKLSIFALLAGSAAAFQAPTMTFAVGKKVAKAVKKATAPSTVPSQALPFENAPGTLDGSLPGDVGFDPCFLTTKADLMAEYFNGLPLFKSSPGLDGLSWYREIELIHGRLAQMAVLGFIFPGLFHFVPAPTNPLEAIGGVPAGGLYQVFAFMAILELRRIRIINKEGKNYMPGDFGWGQGEGRWNPFNFKYTPEQYFEKQVQETKHGRLAMIALLGLYLQASISGVGVIDQLAPAFSSPEYYAKSGYFFPEGI